MAEKQHTTTLIKRVPGGDVQQLSICRGGALSRQFRGYCSERRLHAFVIVIPTSHPVELRDGSGQVYSLTAPAVVDPNCAHSLFSPNGCATVFVDPDTTGRALYNVSPATSGVWSLDAQCSKVVSDLVDGFVQDIRGDSDGYRLSVTLDAVVAAIARGEAARRPLDPRIAEVQRVMRAEPTRCFLLSELGPKVQLSPSRLRHLFREHTGATLREYSLWLRCLVATDLLARRVSLSDVAKRAGFCDQSHLSRMYRKVMGVRPSRITVQYRVSEQTLLSRSPVGATSPTASDSTTFSPPRLAPVSNMFPRNDDTLALGLISSAH